MIPSHPVHRPALGNPAGALGGFLMTAPATVLGPLHSLLSRAVDTAKAADYASPFVDLLLFAVRLVYRVESLALMVSRSGLWNASGTAGVKAALDSHLAELRNTLSGYAMPLLSTWLTQAEHADDIAAACTFHGA